MAGGRSFKPAERRSEAAGVSLRLGLCTLKSIHSAAGKEISEAICLLCHQGPAELCKFDSAPLVAQRAR
jgi:hypothetical protein